MAKKQEKEIERWVTVNGARVPIFKDGSVGGPKALRDKVKAAQDKKNKVAKNKAFKEATANRKAHKEGKKPLPSSFDDMTSQEREEWRKKTEKAFKAGEDKKSGSKERLSVYERQLAEVNDELANAPKSKALRNEEGIRELEKKKAQLEGYIAKEKGTKKSEVNKKVPKSITSAKNMSELNNKLKSSGLSMESADASAIKRDYRSMNGEKVSLYDKDGNEYRGTFNRYSDGGTEIVDIKKERYNTKDDDTKEKQIARNKAEADERNGKNKESYEPYEPQDAEEWAQDLYDSDNYVGDEHIEEQLERELRGAEGAKRYDIEDYEVIRNEDGGRYGDVKVRYALEFEDGLEHREGVYRLRVRDLPAGSKEEEAYKARIAKKKKEAKANMSPKAKTSQKKKNETVEQAMDRLQKESRAKVDSMSAQQVMKYAKENGLRGLKTDTLAQRDERVANHIYMQEMKKWRAQKAQDEFNKQDLKDTKAYERQQKKAKEAREAEERRREREFGSWMANKDDKSLAHSHRDVMKKYGMGSKEHQAFIEEMKQRGFQYIDGVWRKVRK